MTYGQPPADNQGGTGTPGGTGDQVRFTPQPGGGAPPPSGGSTNPPSGGYTPPPAGGSYTPPPAGGGYSAPPPSTYAAPTAAAGGGTNTMAIISLVLGIIALLPLCTLVFGVASIVLGLIAAILGFMARNQIKQRMQGGSGLAMAGLVLGILALIIGVLETAGLGALFGLGAQAVNQMLTMTAGATPGP